MTKDAVLKAVRQWKLSCDITNGWWNVVEFPGGFYPKGRRVSVVEASAFHALLESRDELREALLKVWREGVTAGALKENVSDALAKDDLLMSKLTEGKL